MRRIRSGLLLVLLTAVVVNVVWWTIEPMLPYVLVGLLTVWIFGFIIRRWRW
ncbi:hypothetical protein [Fodinicola acaciae]|uniref:hypothetical protein n=1 Tax=Fodinicola acaciae TaxID=2681555 RepID=UPI0013D7F223|nr:hypothetical protein [Fodinicola acaciae]